MKLSRLRNNRLATFISLAVIVLFVLGGVMVLANRQQSISNTSIAVPSNVAIKDSSNVSTASDKVSDKQDDKSSAEKSVNTGTNGQQPTQSSPQVYVEPPCIKLEHNASSADSEYFKQISDSISIIYKEIHDRYDYMTDSYSDLGTVRASVVYANNLLDKKYSEVTSAYNTQLSSGCHYTKGGVYEYHLPVISDYPQTWAQTANDTIKYY